MQEKNVWVDIGTFQNDMTNIHNRDDVLTLLVHLGYLAYDRETESVSIPNEEVRQEFMRAVKSSRYTDIVKLIMDSEKLLQDTFAMNEESVSTAIENIHRTMTAPTFYNNEQALRSVIRFAYISCIGSYVEIQELPFGKGYADVVFLPKKSSSLPALFIELKWNKTEESAIKQIKENDYPEVLKSYGGRILLIGINYDPKSQKHSCRIEEYRN